MPKFPIHATRALRAAALLLLAPFAAHAQSPKYETAFDALWHDMDRNYSYFDHKAIDWTAIGDRHRSDLAAISDDPAFVALLQRMLGELRDAHVRIVVGDEMKGTFSLGYQGNWNWNVILDDLTEVAQYRDFAYTARTKADGFGYFAYIRQDRATEPLVRDVIRGIRSLKDAPGFIVDLRTGASGGDESLARLIASEFCAEETVYALSKYRAGPAHTEFTPDYPRRLPPSDAPYTKPVVCLLGSRVMSSGEGLAKMFAALPHVTTLGVATRGSSGNPRRFQLPELDIAVSYSRWVDMLPDGAVVEGRGIVPEILDEHSPETFRESDPTWVRAQEVLRELITGSAQP